jgi:hypothetical protein
MHMGISSSMDTLGKVYMGAGLLSATIGGIMAACAVAVAGTSWIPGVDAATEAAATATAETSSGVFRTILEKLVTLIGTAGRLLKSIKGLLALAGIGYAGTKAGGLDLKGAAAMPTYWPGVSQPGQMPA